MSLTSLLTWLEAFALKEIDALTVVRTPEKEIFARYGYLDIQTRDPNSWLNYSNNYNHSWVSK